MKLSTFIKRLQKLEASGHGGAKVTVDKKSLWDGNGVFEICDVAHVEPDWIRTVDGDGFGIENQDGSERGKSCVVIGGIYYEKAPHDQPRHQRGGADDASGSSRVC